MRLPLIQKTNGCADTVAVRTVGLLPGAVLLARIVNCSMHDPGGNASSFSGCVAVLLLNLLALPPATVVIVAVNVCVVGTIAVPVGIIVIVM